MAELGYSRTAFYEGIKQGIVPKPVNIGVRSVALPDFEIEAVAKARIAGRSEAEIRTLVADLEAKRKALA